MSSTLWISLLLPPFIIMKLGLLSLMLIGYLVERKFVGRVAAFSNAMAINLHLFTTNYPDQMLILYANIGLLIGVAAIITYALRIHMPWWFYKLTWLYHSALVGIIILITGVY
jgi:hypothetical protein